MPTLLHISVSPRGNQSISRRLSNTAVEGWKESNPEGRVIERDLAKTPLTFVRSSRAVRPEDVVLKRVIAHPSRLKRLYFDALELFAVLR